MVDNGVLLLNISPMADGTIPSDQQKVLLDMGGWLNKYGEAIYDTRPWYIHGEGPTVEPEGHYKNNKAFLNITYSWKDIRYTTLGKTIFATMLGWPGAGEVVELVSFASDSLAVPVNVKSVSLLGSEEEVVWSQSDEGLSLTMPVEAPNEMAVVFRIKQF